MSPNAWIEHYRLISSAAGILFTAGLYCIFASHNLIRVVVGIDEVQANLRRVDAARAAGVMALDTETSSLDALNAALTVPLIAAGVQAARTGDIIREQLRSVRRAAALGPGGVTALPGPTIDGESSEVRPRRDSEDLLDAARGDTRASAIERACTCSNNTRPSDSSATRA